MAPTSEAGWKSRFRSHGGARREKELFLVMNRFLALAVFAVVLLGCRGPGGPVERAGRGVDNAVYDVGTDIKRAGQKIQRAAE